MVLEPRTLWAIFRRRSARSFARRTAERISPNQSVAQQPVRRTMNYPFFLGGRKQESTVKPSVESPLFKR